MAILALYSYTLYQKYQAEKKIEAFYQQKTKEIRQEQKITEEQ
ncbi:8696_t:CDS:2 [Funneliformis geosporum]|uniref:8696_t:CDS:1 n=1 Tax=Funneliformis geosporum TaxID=1117311 RepID=A0A9W4WU21_9GLOM|nr:8696_t:CDS:2 [Funneliformis geosporum]